MLILGEGSEHSNCLGLLEDYFDVQVISEEDNYTAIKAARRNPSRVPKVREVMLPAYQRAELKMPGVDVRFVYTNNLKDSLRQACGM